MLAVVLTGLSAGPLAEALAGVLAGPFAWLLAGVLAGPFARPFAGLLPEDMLAMRVVLIRGELAAEKMGCERGRRCLKAEKDEEKWETICQV